MKKAPTLDELKVLLKTLSLEFRQIVLVSGQESGVYVDCKQTALHPDGASALGYHLYQQMVAIEKDLGKTVAAVGGMSIGADPLATAVAGGSSRGSPFTGIFGSQAKSHGTQSYLEGLKNIPEGSDVMLLEDVVTTGGSTIRAAERVRGAGLEPIGVSLIIDRESGGMENLTESGLRSRALFTLSELT